LKVYFFGEVIGEILSLVSYFVCYGLGRRAVSFLSGGFVRPAEIRDESLRFPWYGLTRGRDGTLVLSDTFAFYVGLLVFFVLIAVFVWVLNALRQPGA